MYKWKISIPDLDQNNLADCIYRSKGLTDYLSLFSLDETNINNPFLLKDMDKTVTRIKDAIKTKESILIYGDYDVDGITSTYVLYKTLKILGAKVSYDIPNLFEEGYGLSFSKAYEIINDDYNLVITVDNGIKSIAEAVILKENNVDLIITDHHEYDKQLPDALAILHTELSEYPFKPLAGVGVAFKLSQALLGKDAYQFIDIVALGTIADMMPLIDENRAIVNLGLKKMKNSQNIGLAKLISFLNLFQPSVADIQYKIAPRINACGRMGSAKLAVELFLSKDNKSALKTIEEIELSNNKRKKLTKVLYSEALLQLNEKDHSIIIHSPRMHIGVLGIVASRLANEYSKISVVLKEDDQTFKGSIRSYNSADLIYILGELKDILIRYGGHQNAAGLEFKKEHLAEFKRRFNELVPCAIREDDTVAEGIIDIYELDINQIIELEKYDLKNSLFIFDNITIENKFLISDEHTKLIISSSIEAIFFNNRFAYSKILKTSKIALLGRLDVNTFRGKSKKQILIEDYYIY